MPGIDGPRFPALLPVPGQSPVRPMFRTLGIASSGLSAQRQRMETIAQNIANADTTRGADGTPYRRRVAVAEAATAATAKYVEQNLPGIAGGAPVPFTPVPADNDAFLDGPRPVIVPVLPTGPAVPTAGAEGQYGVSIAGIAEDQSEGRLVYEPGHPDADANGYVRYPNVDTTQELVHLMDAKRIYEANASVFQAAKSMLRAALDI